MCQARYRQRMAISTGCAKIAWDLRRAVRQIALDSLSTHEGSTAAHRLGMGLSPENLDGEPVALGRRALWLLSGGLGLYCFLDAWGGSVWPRRQSTLVGLADVTLTISLLGEQCVCAKRVRSRTGGCPYNVDDYEKRHSGAEAKQRVGEQTGAARQVRRRARSGESVSDVYSSVNSGASDEIRKY
ncbi:hypothetical protein Tco_1041814 [Tanacetum coccineum]|uniref:Uncharacterized protein n=1 Tax=Tanacetum coccineum TaxID=301880 RepID=A0ABQ5GIE0_9ASTR